jgi:competence CoiA-like predicted nuclease
MQIVFNTEHSTKEFSVKNNNIFPEPPGRCPFKDCALPVKLKKHGYYTRYFISKTFTDILYIRRYICPVCGRTVSMLPVFCLPKYQYSGPDIIHMMNEFYQSGISLKEYVERIREYFPFIDRRHINYYRRRVSDNRKFIQYGLNLISPGLVHLGTIPENQMWAKEFFEKVSKIHWEVFLSNFYQSTGNFFMALQNIVA